MSFTLGRQTINTGSCADLPTLVRQIQEVVDALDNPGPIVGPGDVANSPCGEIIGSAYVTLVDGVPTVVYVDEDGVCQSIAALGGDSDATIIRGTVSSVSPFQATVDEVITGTEASPTVTFINPFGNTWTVGDAILGFKIQSGANVGKYVPDRDNLGSGGSSFDIDAETLATTNLLVHFELTQNLTKVGTEATGTDLINGGTVYLLDPGQQWFGWKAYADTDTNAAAYNGFRGYGIKYSNNHVGPGGPTGNPSYRILNMEGWRRALVVELKEDAEVGDSPVQCDVVEEYAGVSAGGRQPRVLDDNYDIEVYDGRDILGSGKTGEKYLALLRDTDDGTGGPRYDLVTKLGPFYQVCKGNLTSAVTRADATFTIDAVEVVHGDRPATTLTVQNTTPYKIDAPDNTPIYVVYDPTLGGSATSNWHAGHGRNLVWLLRGRPDFDDTKRMVIYNYGDTEPDLKWKEVAQQDVVTSIDSVELTNPTSTSLRVEISYSKRACEIIAGGAVASGQVINDDLEGTEC